MTVEIEGADGKPCQVGMKQITRGERKKLRIMLLPAEFNPNDENTKINTEKFEAYNDQLVLSSIESPEALRSVAALEALPDSSFQKLTRVANELNPQVTEAIEKK